MPGFSATDHAMMARALRIAERGTYTTRPNPMVGCVVAHGDEIVGEGWHQKQGGPHAEVFALEAAGGRANGATAYVTLEPCAHVGSTPPCTDALLAAGVARVVAAMRDPNPQVDGSGFAKLQAAGIAVESGLMEAQARELNRGFLSRIERGRPWLRIKLASSIDGRSATASGDSKWISGEASRRDVQHWRARSGAILTGAGTVLMDDPHLTVRLGDDTAFVPPWRVVLDPGLATVARGHVREGDAPTLYLHAPDAKPPRDMHAEHVAVAVQGGRFDLAAVLRLLGERGINEVQVEAGATLAGGFLADGLVDELLLYVAPVMLGERARPLFEGLHIDAMTERLKMRIVESRRIGEDVRVLLRPEPGQ
ncbi:MAG TPA: bifunctional diaminohydroxyphosphoribosylaminopyrimidine deaminase/5-amino-6-(5-phosphoribosylamino)uracil reductase RibD [Lysobacter sp.]|nr:bifunctional diaminohydroxyphosphoribosylaminopyrimidine deaminase/5-amino-6-(5-phosphoribosylamino)uracil reductase RibD [Lysobacter sp.]